MISKSLKVSFRGGNVSFPYLERKKAKKVICCIFTTEIVVK